MPQFSYKGRDKNGLLKTGTRSASNIETLNAALTKEGIYPIHMAEIKESKGFLSQLQFGFQSESLHFQELSIFSRQMQLLEQAGVPLVISLKQLATYTRSRKLAYALKGVIGYLEMGHDLASSMRYYPDVFSQLMISIVQIGETTGHLSDAFGHLHRYLEFESHNLKQLKSSFRYPIFVIVSIFLAIIALNIFVIPTFANFYTNIEGSLPWQTRLLIGMSNFTLNYGLYILIAFIVAAFFFFRYLRTPQGKYYWGRFQLHFPVSGKLLKRITLIRFCQSLAIVVNSGIGILQGLKLVKNLLPNRYIAAQITEMEEAIARGTSFTHAITKIELFAPLELQILSVGEKNGELGPALDYIGNFHGQEIEYDLKKLNDLIGPILITVVSIMILIIALGVYLPVWNMINLIRT